MRPLGARRPVEIDPICANTHNADLVFPSDNLILEIKCLIEDPQASPDFEEKLSTLYRKWASEGRVPILYGTATISTHDLPIECARELLLRLNGSVREHVVKANAQIKKTKAALGMQNACGALVLCNSGNRTTRPDVLLHGLDRILGNKFSAINWVIYMTHGLPIKLPNIPFPTEIFANVVRRGGKAMPDELFGRIRNAWLDYRKRFGEVRFVEADGQERLFDIEHE